MIESFDKCALKIWKVAEEAGWHDRETGEKDRLMTYLALIHSEVSEAVEALRKHGTRSWTEVDGKPEGWGAELADVLIRTLELMYMTDVEIDVVVEQKIEYNRRRLDVPKHSKEKAF